MDKMSGPGADRSRPYAGHLNRAPTRGTDSNRTAAKGPQNCVAAVLLGLGLYRIVRDRHFRWGGMQVGFRDLTIWSFLMASAHGARLMVLPVVLTRISLGAAAGHHMHPSGFDDPLTGVAATLVHTLR